MLADKIRMVLAKQDMDIVYMLVNNSTGKLGISEDGITWKSYSKIPIDPVTAIVLRDVSFVDGKWVIVGSQGTILVSTDFKNWIQSTNHPFGTGTIMHIEYGYDKWVATTTNGLIGWSTDGLNWEASISPFAMSVQGIAYGNGRWVAIGYASDCHAAVSDNGKDWIEVAGTPLFGNYSYGAGLAFADGKFVGVGMSRVAHSTDGLQWNITDLPISTQGLTYGNGKWVVWGSGLDGAEVSITYSTNLISWSTTTINGFYDEAGGLYNVYDMLYDGGKWIACGKKGRIATSVNGVSWTPIETGLNWESPYNSIGYIHKPINKSIPNPLPAPTYEDELELEITVPVGNWKFPTGSYSAINGEIDWGDGSTKSKVTSFFSSDLTHYYGMSGTYVVKFKGVLSEIYANSYAYLNPYEYPNTIKKVLKIGNELNLSTISFRGTAVTSTCKMPTTLTTASDLFGDCLSLTTIPSDMFSGCIHLTNVSGCFAGSGLQGALDGNMFLGLNILIYDKAFHVSVANIPRFTGSWWQTIINNANAQSIKPESTYACFAGQTKLTNYNSIPSAWRLT